MFKTGELSKAFEIDRTSLNYYVKTGLLNPEVLDNQYHVYSFQDAIALSYIRYYRGLGFDTKDIKAMTKDADNNEILKFCDTQMNSLEEQIKLLQMKQRFLEHLKNSIKFHETYYNQSLITDTEGYYFIKKEDIQDPVMKELYRLIPSNEFEAVFDDKYQVTLKSAKSAQGLALKEVWMNDFDIPLPEKAIYYPPKKKCLCSFHLNGKTYEKDFSSHIERTVKQMNIEGYSIENDFVVYLFINHYNTENEALYVFAQFNLKPLD